MNQLQNHKWDTSEYRILNSDIKRCGECGSLIGISDAHSIHRIVKNIFNLQKFTGYNLDELFKVLKYYADLYEMVKRRLANSDNPERFGAISHSLHRARPTKKVLPQFGIEVYSIVLKELENMIDEAKNG